MPMDELKAKQYSIRKYLFSFIELFETIFFLAVFYFFGFSSALKNILGFLNNYYLIVLAYIFSLSCIFYIFMLPLNFYKSFVLEHRFNLSNQNIGNWAQDQIKSFILGLVISLILVGAFYFIVLNFSWNWWIITSLFWIFFSLILAKLTPILIIPLFFKYTPLSDTELKSRIINLANKMQINILDVSQIDFSKKTLKANAAFVGMGKQKRVILADTLRDNYNYDEIETILAHEFAHYKLKHLLKLILVSSFLTIFMFYFLGTNFLQDLLKINPLSNITYLPIILLFVILFDTIFTPFKNFLSRKFEENADRLALRFTLKPDAFVSMMGKLANQNLADRKPAWFIKIFFFDHPAIEDRINLAKKFK